MIPNHDDAVNAALLAIAKAFQAGKPGQEEWPAESVEERALYILQELANPGTRDANPREDQTAMLAERCDAVALPVGVIVRLMLDAMKVPWLERGYESLRGFEKDVWKVMASARKIMKDTRLSHDERIRKALFELGSIGENGGAGADRRDHQRIADHYFALRRGAPNTLWEGKILKPHSHADAKRLVEECYDISWESLKHAWRRKKIKVCIKAEVFPIK